MKLVHPFDWILLWVAFALVLWILRGTWRLLWFYRWQIFEKVGTWVAQVIGFTIGLVLLVAKTLWRYTGGAAWAWFAAKVNADLVRIHKDSLKAPGRPGATTDKGVPNA